MRGGAWPLAGFGTFVGVMGVVNRIWADSAVQSATFGFAALVSFLGAAILFACAPSGEALRRGAPGVDPRPRAVPAASLGAVALGVGTAAAVFGAVFGMWLIIFGLGLWLAGAFLLVRELSAQRRAARRALADPASTGPVP